MHLLTGRNFPADFSNHSFSTKVGRKKNFHIFDGFNSSALEQSAETTERNFSGENRPLHFDDEMSNGYTRFSTFCWFKAG
jgi:hypothetical protein